MKATKACLAIGLAAILSFFATCKDGAKTKEADNTPMSKDSSMQTSGAADTNVAIVTPKFMQIDPKAAAGIKGIVDDYLKLKNALAADNGSGAADAGKNMDTDLGKLDPSLLRADQKKVYDSTADDLKEHAEHIGKNGGNIAHQREHFAMMSQDVYSLVKAFGGGQALYHDHCPMYQKGAMWVSELAEIKNPYLGGKMPTCGDVKEKIK
jgi:hypothetical protein